MIGDGKIHNCELHGLCSSPTIVWVIRSRRMTWIGRGGDTAHVGNKRNAYRV